MSNAKTPERLAIEAALELNPADWDYNENQRPFYNDAEGHSCGGDSSGTYALFGEPFEIEGEAYDGPVLSESCSRADAHFISACKPSVIRSLLSAHDAELAAKDAEIVRLRMAAEFLLARFEPSIKDYIFSKRLAITELRAALAQGASND